MGGASAYPIGVRRRKPTHNRFTQWVKENWISNSCLRAGNSTCEASDEALTPSGGWVAWDHFLEHCGVIAELATNYPLPRTSPNATPVADILKAFSLNRLIGGTRLCLHMKWRKGNTVSSSVWIEAMEKVWRSPIAQHRIRLNRGDIGFGQEAIMARHEQGGSAKKTSARLRHQPNH